MFRKLLPFLFPLFFSTLHAQQDSASNDYESPQLFQYKIIKPIQAKVKAKINSSSSPEWSVYRSKKLDEVVGKIKVGESVSIVDWDYHVYRIKEVDFVGYISWLAVSGNPQLDSLSKIVSKYANLDTENRLRKTLSGKNPLAKLEVSANKKEIYVGECVTITLSFNVNVMNQARIQFVDLENQIPKIHFAKSQLSSCWSTEWTPAEITGIRQRNNEAEYFAYRLKTALLCPSKALDIQISPLEFHCKRYIYQAGDDFELANFHSEPVTTKVKPLPEGLKPTSHNSFKLVGKFTLEDSLSAPLVKTGESVLYKLKISGEGLTFPIDPPKIQIANAVSEIVDTQDSYFVLSGVYNSERTFVYSITFNQEGSYNFKNCTAFTFFDPLQQKLTTLKPKAKITVVPGQEIMSHKRQGTYNVYNNLILLDISTSMMMEDYQPNRLKYVTEGIRQFLVSRKNCDIGLIVFSGDAAHYNISKADSCYSGELISNIGFTSKKVGTAIGDAIWMAKNSLHESTSPKLVIIGDGDNTTGSCSPELAVAIAKKKNIKISTIGVGTKGPVTMGVDKYGRPQFYEKSFDDEQLKDIALQTGGKYYWAKDSSQISVILKSIFP